MSLWFLKDDKVMDGIKEAGELGEELFENGLAYFKGLNKIVKEDRQHKNRRETGTVHTTL